MKNNLLIASFILLVILLSAFFIWPIFTGQYTSFPLSIESVFITEANFVLKNFPNINWYPFWYFGLPFNLVYQPVPIFLPALLSFFTGFVTSQSYRILTGLFLILGPVGLFFWTRYLTKNLLVSFASAVSFALLPSVAYLFLPGSWSGYGFIPLRIVNTLVYGEGPHMWGLALLPFACIYYQKLLRHPERELNWVLSIFFITSILLTSLTAFVGLLVFLFFIFLRVAAIRHRLKRSVLVSLIIAGFSLGISFFWYSPDFVSSAFDYSFGDGGGMFVGVWRSLIFSLFAIPSLLILIYFCFSFLLKKEGVVREILLPLAIFALLFFEILVWFKWDTSLFPLPFRTIPRLIPELELAFSLLLGVSLSQFSRKTGYLLSTFLILISLGLGWVNRENFTRVLRPHTNFSKTSEFVISDYLKKNKAREVYATGTHAFWLNLFADSIQLRGGKGGDFGGINPWWAHLSFFINQGEDRDRTMTWLRNLGFEYIVVNFPQSSSYYHDFKNLERFGGLRVIFDYKGDKILKVGTKNSSLALLVPKDSFDKIERPQSLISGNMVLDEARANSYFRVMEEEGLSLKSIYPFGNWSKIRIPEGQNTNSGDILIRQTYYPGWQALSGGKVVEITKDPLGFILIKNPGNKEIVLSYHFPLKMYLSIFISFVSLGGFVFFLKSSLLNKLALW